MQEHECKRELACLCDGRLEPHDECPKHGSPEVWPPRCIVCGRWFKDYIGDMMTDTRGFRLQQEPK